MPDQIALFKLDSVWRRLLLLVPAALACAGVWYSARWFVGNTLAVHPPGVEVVRAAESLAPDDPQVHFTLGVYARRSFEPGDLQETARRFELATARSPRDYRLWMELGRAREQAGDAAGGERALRRALELAPGYVMPRWYLGNLLLRAGRYEEAVAELRAASNSDRELRGQIFNSVWGIFDGDVGRVTAAVAETPPVKAELVEYLVRQKRVDDAVRVWSLLRPEERRGQHAAGEALSRGLLERRRHREALSVHNDYSSASPPPAVGQFTHGSFEGGAGQAKNPFGWSVTPAPQVQMGLDPGAAHTGTHSLRVSFNAPSNIGFTNVAQLVAVEPGARYRLSFFVRTENLKSASTLVADVLSAAEGNRALASSAPAPAGTNDWQEVSVEFSAPTDADAVVVRLRRLACGDDVCPIFGKIWYDDFSLQRVGGGDAGARRRQGAPSAGGPSGDAAALRAR